jgi:hypothetical protein
MRTRGTAYGTKGDVHDNTFDEDEDNRQYGGTTFEDSIQDEAEATIRTGTDSQTGTETKPMRQGTAPRAATVGTYSAVLTAIDRMANVSTTTLEEEIDWQLGPDVTKEEIANQMELKIFMILRPTSIERAITLVHGIAQSWASGYGGKYIAITGDATDAGNTLTAVALQEKKTWELVKKTVSTDVTTWAAEVQANPTIKKKLWACSNDQHEVEVPCIMHVPLCLAKYMYGEGKRYTPYDVHNIIMTQYVEDETELVPKCWERISTWCLVAQQTDDICLDVSAITEPDREFVRWTAARIATTLGYKHGEVIGSQGQQSGLVGDANTALANAVGQGVAPVMLQQGTNQTGGSTNQRSNGGKESTDGYDRESVLLQTSQVASSPPLMNRRASSSHALNSILEQKAVDRATNRCSIVDEVASSPRTCSIADMSQSTATTPKNRGGETLRSYTGTDTAVPITPRRV